MNFEVEHVFDAPVEIVEAAMFHPDYAIFLVEHSELISSAALKSFEDDGLHIRRRVQVAPRPSFDRIGSKRVPPEWFEFIEESIWDRKVRKLSFENIPITDKIASRLTTRGEITLESLSSGKTRRCARGEVTLRDLPLLVKPLRPLVEQMLTREAKRMLDAEAQIMREFLASPHRLSPTVHA
jgi:hypothetical protein